MAQQQRTPESLAHQRSAKSGVTEPAITPPTSARPKALFVTTPGWHELTEEDYHSDPCLSHRFPRMSR